MLPPLPHPGTNPGDALPAIAARAPRFASDSDTECVAQNQLSRASGLMNGQLSQLIAAPYQDRDVCRFLRAWTTHRPIENIAHRSEPKSNALKDASEGPC